MKNRNDVSDRPDLYDLLYEGFDEDVEMYIKLADNCTEVLECGIGTGRIAIPMAKKGITVFGIDNSVSMLKTLNAKRKRLPAHVKEKIQPAFADMRNFQLKRKFNYIFTPFSTFNYLLTIDDQLAALNTMNKHLDDKGTLVIELISFSLFPNWLNNDHNPVKSIQKVDSKTGKIVEMWRTFRFDSASQIIEQDRHYRYYDNMGRLEDEVLVLWKNRLVLLGEMHLLMEKAGFKIDNVYGDCEFGAYKHSSEFYLIVASKK
jgi:ubiquinone/menaquinone biosynthesis C-methylase UbiE